MPLTKSRKLIIWTSYEYAIIPGFTGSSTTLLIVTANKIQFLRLNFWKLFLRRAKIYTRGICAPKAESRAFVQINNPKDQGPWGIGEVKPNLPDP